MRSRNSEERKLDEIARGLARFGVEWDMTSQVLRSPMNETFWKVHTLPKCVRQGLHSFLGP